MLLLVSVCVCVCVCVQLRLSFFFHLGVSLFFSRCVSLVCVCVLRVLCCVLCS